MTAAELIAMRIAQLGVRHVFGVGGANIEDLFGAFQRQSAAVRVVLAKHEFSAGTMADGYARVSGGMGVVLTTSGAGAMNVIPALAESRASRVPVLAIAGEPPTALQGLGAFQDTSGQDGGVDARQLFSAVSVFCARVESPDELPDLLEQAIEAALGVHPGPAVLLIAKDVQRGTVSEGATRITRRATPRMCAADPACVARAARLLSGRLEGPFATGCRAGTQGDVVIIAGDGVARGGAKGQLASLAGALGARVAVTPDGRDAFDNDSPHFLGVAGMVGNATLRRALVNARVTLVVGTRAPLLVRQGYEQELLATSMVVLGPEAAFMTPEDSVHVRADVRLGLEALLRQVAPVIKLPEPAAGPSVAPAPSLRTEGLSCRSVLTAIDSVVAEDANVLVDAGNTGAHAIKAIRAPRWGRWLLATGMAGMGYTFGAAIGAALASGKPTVVVAGDGAFFMHGMEIHTAVEYALPITYVILNNNAHGMCLTRDRLLLGQQGANHQFESSRIGAGLAAMFPGLLAVDCATTNDLHEALASGAVGAGGPRLICAEVDASEIPPFMAFERASARTAASACMGGGDDEVNRYRKAV